MPFRALITSLALAVAVAAPAAAQDHHEHQRANDNHQQQHAEHAQPRQQPQEQHQQAPHQEQRQQAQPRNEARPQQVQPRQEQPVQPRNDVAVPRQNNRGYQNRGYDNRGYENRGYENRGNDNRGYNRGNDNRGYDNRGYNGRYDNRGYDNRGYNGRYENRGNDIRRWDNRRYESYITGQRRYNAFIVRPQIVRVIPYQPYRYRPSFSIGVYYGSDGYYPYGYTPDYYFNPIPGRAYGGVRITGAPEDAQVFADGYYVGIVDDFDGIFQHMNLEAGPHHIEVAWGGYQPIAFDVYVRPGETTTFRADGFFRY